MVRGRGSGIRGRAPGGGRGKGAEHRDAQRLVPAPSERLCLRPARPSPGAVHSHRHRWAPGPGRHFGFFFSFVGLVSSASWSLLSFIIFLPSGVLKYQSWERGGGGGKCPGSGPGPAPRARPLRADGFPPGLW